MDYRVKREDGEAGREMELGRWDRSTRSTPKPGRTPAMGIPSSFKFGTTSHGCSSSCTKLKPAEDSRGTVR